MRKNTTATLTTLAAALVVLGGGEGRAMASSITWNPSQNISGDSDVVTDGTFDRAYVFSNQTTGGASTVNGVTFTPFPERTNGDSGTFASALPPGEYGTPNAPYSNLSTAYRAILGTGNLSDTTAGVTLTGLTPGTTYEVEVFANISFPPNTESEMISGGPLLAYNTTDADGGLGQFAVGTFVADATGTQTLTFVSSSGPNVFINALELREIPSTVPEPSSLVLCGLAGVIGSAYAWRRRKPAAMA